MPTTMDVSTEINILSSVYDGRCVDGGGGEQSALFCYSFIKESWIFVPGVTGSLGAYDIIQPN